MPFVVGEQWTRSNLCWRTVARKTTDGGQEAAIRVLGVKAVLDGPAVDLYVVLLDRQCFAIGNADHLLNEVDTCNHLGDGVFHLKAGVHLEEVEVLVAVYDEFDRPCGGVTNSLGQCYRLLAHRLARFGVEKRAGRFFDNFLVAALDRAFTLVQVNAVAVGVTEDLNFDVARVGDEFLDEDTVIAEGVGRLVFGGLEPLARFLVVPCDAHAFAATACGRFEHDRIADLARDFHRLIRVFDDAHIARNCAYTCFLGDLLGGDLIPHLFNRTNRGAYECNTFSGQCFGEFGVLGEETIARMHRLCARGFDRFHHFVDDDVGLIGGGRSDMDCFIRHLHMQRLFVRVGIDCNGLDAHFLGGFYDAAGNLATVGDQDLIEHIQGPYDGETVVRNAKRRADQRPARGMR